jgi:hypothetical protein
MSASCKDPGEPSIIRWTVAGKLEIARKPLGSVDDLATTGAPALQAIHILSTTAKYSRVLGGIVRK